MLVQNPCHDKRDDKNQERYDNAIYGLSDADRLLKQCNHANHLLSSDGVDFVDFRFR